MVTADTTTRSPWRIFGLVAGSVALATLNFSMIFVAFGEISDSFDASDSTISWALTGFAITTAAVIVPGGWLADRFGRTRIFLIGFALFLAGSAGVAAAPTVEFLIAARVLQAAGLAIEAPASFALVLNAFPKRMRSTAVGAMGAAGGVAAALGPLVGGALVEALGWRWAFFCNVPVGIVVLALVGPRLPPNRVHLARKTPDLIGVLLLMFGVGSLALGIVQSDDWGFGDVRTVAALIAALILLAGLVQRSRAHQEPILYVPLFANHDFRVGSASTNCTLVTAPEQVAAPLRGSRTAALMAACCGLRPGGGEAVAAAKMSMRCLARRHRALSAEISELDAEIARLCAKANPALIAARGVGADTAAALLIAAGDNPQRLRSEASFAALCGACPVEASSGRTVRHRLNRGGDRQANNALWRIATVRLRCDQQTKNYAARRRAEGKNDREIIRCLKRYIAREIYRLLTFFLAGNFMGSFLAFVTFLYEGWGLSLFKAGLAVGLIPAIGGPMSVVSGRLADRFGHRTVILPGALLMAAGGLWMWSAAGSQPQIWSLWVPVVVVYGIGVGLGHAACQSAALSTVNEDRLGIGGAMNRIFMEIGGTISIAVVIALFVRYDDPVDGLRASMLLLVIVSAISVPIAASLHNRGHA